MATNKCVCVVHILPWIELKVRGDMGEKAEILSSVKSGKNITLRYTHNIQSSLSAENLVALILVIFMFLDFALQKVILYISLTLKS